MIGSLGEYENVPTARFRIASLALIVQWIERLTPNEQIHVRLMVRAHKICEFLMC